VFVSCSDTVLIHSTAFTLCVGTRLAETTIPIVVLNSSTCLQMYKTLEQITELVNCTIVLYGIRLAEEGLKSFNIEQDFKGSKMWA
jgi:hypothetical protein